MQQYPSEYESDKNHIWTDCRSASPILIGLSSRVATLEAQLVRAHAEKAEAEGAIRYILRVQIESAITDAGFAKSAKAASRLRYKLVRLREENRTLKAKLRLVLQLLASQYGSPKRCITHSKASRRLDVHNIQKPKAAEGLLIDLLTSSEPTAVDSAENGTIPSALQKEEEERGTDDDKSGDSGVHQKITSYAAVDLSRTPYIYRFGHGNGSSAPNIDIDREQNSNKKFEIINKISNFAIENHDPTVALSAKKLFRSQQTFPENKKLTPGNLREVGFEVALPSLNTSFDSSSTIAVPTDDSYLESPSPEVRPKDPKWSSPQIFSSLAERGRAIDVNRHNAGPKDLRFPDLFRHGIRFSPDPSDRDLYRTILVSDLALNTTLTALLNKVRGGLVVSAMLLDTATITGNKTALIVFHHEHEAMTCEENAKLHPVEFDGRTARVELVPTPTWPEPINLRKAINDHHHTRCLKVHKFPRRINPTMLRRDLRICDAVAANAIEHMAMRADDVLELRFSSIRYAGQAFGILTTYRDYRQCVPHFVPDPCAQPLQLSMNNKAIEPEKDSGKLDLKQLEGGDFEYEPAVIDQSGRLEKIENNGVTNPDSSTIVRG